MKTAAAFLGISALVIVTPGQDTVLTRNARFARPARRRASPSLKLRPLRPSWLRGTDGAGSDFAPEPPAAARPVRCAPSPCSLGVQALVVGIRGDPAHAADAAHAKRLTPVAGLRQGIVSNLGNPKMAMFFSLAWLSAYAFVVGRAGNVLARRGIRRTLDGIARTVLVAFGIRLASQQR